jgi:putative transposase
MNESSSSHRSRPPFNPGLRDLIAEKRRCFPPPDGESIHQGFRGWHERGYLPHRDDPGLTQLVTFHLEDAFPTALRSEWAALLETENNQEQRKKLESYLDQGRGQCYLRRRDIGQLVEDVLRYHHGTRYQLVAWIIMPNHVHVLFKVGDKPMVKTVGDWKEYAARQANSILGRRGRFWAREFWDVYMRDGEHELFARRYVENNPVKAFLVRDPKAWPWTSARYRDEFGSLCL